MPLQIVVDGMFGSCGKGHLAAQLAARAIEPLVVRTGGPNAGHTVLDERGKAYKLRCLPTAAVSNGEALLCLAAGSVIDPVVLAEEIQLVGAFANGRFSVIIDPAATILEPRHLQREKADSTLTGWSTQKGIGAARADRIHRTAMTARDWNWFEFGDTVRLFPVADLVEQRLRVMRMSSDWHVIIETAQGYGLGLHTNYYPKTTSSDCRAIDALADVGVSPWSASIIPEVWIALRPYPIRVAGNSGPLHGETTWEALGLEPERTTVTNKIRRVGTWDARLVTDAVRANGGPSTNVGAALMMVDQVVPQIAGMTERDQVFDLADSDPAAWETLLGWFKKVEQAGALVRALGTGPATMVFL